MGQTLLEYSPNLFKESLKWYYSLTLLPFYFWLLFSWELYHSDFFFSPVKILWQSYVKVVNKLVDFFWDSCKFPWCWTEDVLLADLFPIDFKVLLSPFFFFLFGCHIIWRMSFHVKCRMTTSTSVIGQIVHLNLPFLISVPWMWCSNKNPNKVLKAMFN